MHMKTIHGNKPVRASKRLPNSTPLVKTAKRSKPDEHILNCEGIVDDDSLLLMENSFGGKDTPDVPV